MGISTSEQETSIGFMRNEDTAYIYTSDSTMMTKFDKLVQKSEHWKLTEEIKLNGEVVGKKYECPKRLLSYRSTIKELTEEQKQAARERMQAMRSKQNDN